MKKKRSKIEDENFQLFIYAFWYNKDFISQESLILVERLSKTLKG